jgi:hypothetical protein
MEAFIMSYNKETRLYEGYIYKIYNNIYPEQIYIGQTTREVKTRWDEHVYKAMETTDSSKLYCKMRVHGISHFNIEIVEKHEALDKQALVDILDEREKYFIEIFDTYSIGLNSTYGGRGVAYDNTREVYQYDIYGTLINKFKSIQEAAYQNGVLESSVIECCQYRHKYCANSIFRYNFMPQEEIVQTIECVCQMDKNYNIVSKYFSCLSASKNTGINVSHICQCCSGKRKTAGGFIWHRYIPNQ